MGTKGIAFLQDAGKAGWEGSVEVEDGQEICTVSYNDGDKAQILVMVWDGARYNDKQSYRLTYDGQKRAVRNASAARDILESAKGVRVKETRAAAGSEKLADDFATPDRPPARPERKKLPFSISQSDSAILAAVLGKEVFWWSERTRSVMSARVMPDPNQRHLRMDNVRSKRTLHWAARGEGFRAVHLDNIVEIRD
jgi:hypothetical protein